MICRQRPADNVQILVGLDAADQQNVSARTQSILAQRGCIVVTRHAVTPTLTTHNNPVGDAISFANLAGRKI
jgi:hypothetical protein